MKIFHTIGLTICLLCLALIPAWAETCLPIKVRNPDGNYIVPGVRGDIVYRRVNGMELSMDAYVQKRGARRPAVIVVHGGGWDSGSRIAFVGQFLEMLTQAGYNWFSVDYRLGGLPKHEEAVGDLRAALTFIRCHAQAFRIDPDRIALFGEDTGAHLAALLAAEKPRGVIAAVLIGGQYDLREIPALKSQGAPPDLLAAASPLAQIKTGMPATMLVHGTADREAPPQQATAYCAAIREAGGRCDYFAVDGGIHRPENWLPQQWGYKGALLSWLAEILRHKEADHEPYLANLKKNIVFSPKNRLKLDAWIPPGKGPFPAVVIAHGGGWEAGDKVTYVTPLFEPLSKAGFAWFSIDYRLTPRFRHPDQLDDLRDAVRFVQSLAKEFRIDPDRVAILGESASGQMVAQVAAEGSLRIAAAVSFYGVYNFYDLVTDASPRSIPARLFGLNTLNDEARAVMRRYSPLHNVHTGMPPLLLIHGTNERLYAQGVEMSRKLAENYAAYDFVEIENAPHGIENWEGHPEWTTYKTKLAEWLRSKLQPRK